MDLSVLRHGGGSELAVDVGSSLAPPPRPNIEQDGFTIANCRGIQLLAIPHNNLLYICVHEIAMELWKMFDTPRVSVQKKITDLGIHLHQTTKAQVAILRREGIIGNFRATMITVRDAERLYDALEYSRRKRGLVKHILKEPGKRATRAEEYGAKKLSTLSRYHQRQCAVSYSSLGENLSPVVAASDRLGARVDRAHARTPNTPPQTVPRDSPSLTSSTPGMWCALNGNHVATKNSNREEAEESDGEGYCALLFDVLLCAADPVLVGSSDCKSHFIELLPNRQDQQLVDVNSATVAIGHGRQGHMDKTLHRHRQSNKGHTHLTTTPNQIAPRHIPPSTGGRRRSKVHDPDYQPSSSYSAKTANNLSHSLQSSRLSRNRERDSYLSTPSTSSGIRVNSLRSRHLSSPPLELNDLEERSSVYSGVSGNSSRLQSSTPERFLYLDESSEEDQEELEGEESDSDSVFSLKRSSSPEMRITVPGKGATAGADRRVVKTKLRHFAQTTSPQLTALSRGKHLPLSTSVSPPPSPPLDLSPLTVSISLNNLQSPQNAQSSVASDPLSPPPPPPPPNSNQVPSVRRKPGRPPNKHKVRATALSTFVTKKRAVSPSTQSDNGSPGPSIPPPAKRSRLEYESDSSNGGRRIVGEEVSSKLKRGRPSLASKGESLNNLKLTSNTAVTNNHHLSRGVQPSDLVESRDSSAANSPLAFQSTTKSLKASSGLDEPLIPRDTTIAAAPSLFLHSEEGAMEDSFIVGPSGCDFEEEVGGDSLYVPDDDQFSVTSSSTTSAPTVSRASLSTGKAGGRGGRGRRSLAANSSMSKRGKQKNQYSNGFGCSFTNELQSLMSSSKSSINFEKFFSHYPPKLVIKDGELVPERSLSVQGIDRNSIGSLPHDHPFLSWNLGQPVKGGVPLRGRKRRPPKAVRIT